MVNKLFSRLPRASRKAAVILSEEEPNTDIILDFLAPFAELEKQVYEKLLLKFSRDGNELRVEPET